MRTLKKKTQKILIFGANLFLAIIYPLDTNSFCSSQNQINGHVWSNWFGEKIKCLLNIRRSTTIWDNGIVVSFHFDFILVWNIAESISLFFILFPHNDIFSWQKRTLIDCFRLSHGTSFLQFILRWNFSISPFLLIHFVSIVVHFRKDYSLVTHSHYHAELFTLNDCKVLHYTVSSDVSDVNCLNFLFN